MYRLFAGAALALVMIVVTASAKEYKNAMIMKADDESITVKFEGSDKEVVVKLNDKTTFAAVNPKDGTEKEVKKEMLAKRLEKATKGMKATITTEGDDKEDPAKDKLVAKKIATMGGMRKTKDTVKKDL